MFAHSSITEGTIQILFHCLYLFISLPSGSGGSSNKSFSGSGWFRTSCDALLYVKITCARIILKNSGIITILIYLIMDMVLIYRRWQLGQRTAIVFLFKHTVTKFLKRRITFARNGTATFNPELLVLGSSDDVHPNPGAATPTVLHLKMILRTQRKIRGQITRIKHIHIQPCVEI